MQNDVDPFVKYVEICETIEICSEKLSILLLHELVIVYQGAVIILLRSGLVAVAKYTRIPTAWRYKKSGGSSSSFLGRRVRFFSAGVLACLQSVILKRFKIASQYCC